ncbi:MAG: DNA polymerase III subunit delta [Clostridia bacterium]|nr:DNA polymerase III subunit delta [Clostridia bacterium]
MAMTETQLKEYIQTGGANLYVLYGAEGYLTEQYARLIARHTVEEGFDAFNLQRFDGQTVTLEQLEEAVEALPLMADRKCVLVRDYDAAAGDTERLVGLISQVPDSCVLVFWQMTVQPDRRKGWKAFLDRAEQAGVVMNFEHKSVTDVAKMLAGGAKRRGCRLDVEDARYLVEQVGNDLNLLQCELDKLCALVGEGEITRRHIDTACPKNLEAKVFDLSKAILYRRTQEAYELLHQLSTQREEPVAVLGVLSNAYADLYRAKVAAAGGVSAQSLAGDFKSYKNKEFRLRHAARDGARLSVTALRDCLDILAQADTSIKMDHGSEWTLLEQTVTRLICRAQEG